MRMNAYHQVTQIDVSNVTGNNTYKQPQEVLPSTPIFLVPQHGKHIYMY